MRIKRELRLELNIGTVISLKKNGAARRAERSLLWTVRLFEPKEI